MYLQGEPRHVIVNTEWGAFGENGELDFIRTKWDEAIDEASLNPGKQVSEKHTVQGGAELRSICGFFSRFSRR